SGRGNGRAGGALVAGLAGGGAWGRRSVARRSAGELPPLLAFFEVVVDQPSPVGHGLLGLLSVAGNAYFGALAGGQHHDLHDVGAIHHLLFRAADAHAAVMPLGNIDELGGGTGVQPQLVDDLDALGNLGHGRSRWRISRLEKLSLRSCTSRSAM